MRPSANPVAIMQIRMTRVAVTDKGFVVTTAGTDGPRPAGVAFGFAMNASAIKEIGLNFTVDSGRKMTEFVRVGINETVARSDVARRRHAEQTEPCAAGMRLADACVQLL